MPQSSYDPVEIEGRQRITDQLVRMQGFNDNTLAWDSEDPADYSFLYVPERLLVDQEAENRFLQVFVDRAEDMPFSGAAQLDPDRIVVEGLRTYILPPDRDNPRSEDVLEVMEIVDDEMEEGQVTIEHYVHLASNGNGRLCPATEPVETGLSAPWPPESTDNGAGTGVDVVVVDTGWVQSVGPNDPPPDLNVYDGHGPFAKEVVRCRAPKANLREAHFPTAGGVVAEGDLVIALQAAIPAMEEGEGGVPQHVPTVINLSAGCHTRRDRPLKAFERLWRGQLKDDPYTVLVAAAGNDASSIPFYPAASDWTWGVGSLDRSNVVSSYSNYRTSADVFVLGRNHINKFPRGKYTCHEAPNKDDERRFLNGWARWSGTSFAAPLLAGMIAAHIPYSTKPTPREAARELIRLKRTWRDHSPYGAHRVIELDQIVP